MFCSKCGNQVPDNARFCEKCGTMILQENAGAQSIAQKPTAKPADTTQKPKISKKKIVIAIVSIIVVIIVGAVVLENLGHNCLYCGKQCAFSGYYMEYDDNNTENFICEDCYNLYNSNNGENNQTNETGNYFVFAPKNSTVAIDDKKLPFSKITVDTNGFEVYIFYAETISVGNHTLVVEQENCETYTRTIAVEKIENKLPKTTDELGELLEIVAYASYEENKSYGDFENIPYVEEDTKEDFGLMNENGEFFNGGAANTYFVSLNYTAEYLDKIKNSALYAFQRISEGFTEECDLSSINFVNEDVKKSVIKNIKNYEDRIITSIQLADEYDPKGYETGPVGIYRCYINQANIIDHESLLGRDAIVYVCFDIQYKEKGKEYEYTNEAFIELVNVEEQWLVYGFECFPIP